jgi:hypothetical protein
LRWRDYHCGRCGQFSRLPENQRFVLVGVNVALLFLFMFAVGRQWQLWQRVTFYVLVSIIVQEAIAQIFMRFEPVKRDVKHEDVV